MARTGRLLPPLFLVVLTPLVAEYLLGDLPATFLVPLPVLALMYGTGAVLVREAVRRAGGGLLTHLLLALAYAVLEEGLVTQSLFNPDYMHQHLLAYGFVRWLGTAPPWAVYVFGLHVMWSLSVPIGLTEALFAGSRRTPWLGRIGLAVMGLLFALGVGLCAAYSMRTASDFASPAQLAAALALVLALVSLAFALRRRAVQARDTAPPPWPVTLLAAGVGGSLFVGAYMLGASTLHWPWQATVGADLMLGLSLIGYFAWAARGRWRALDGWAAAMGGLLAYAWLGFVIDRALHGTTDLGPHAVLTVALCALGAFAGLHAASQARAEAVNASGLRPAQTASKV